MFIDQALVLACLARCRLTQPTRSRYTAHVPITEQEYRERKQQLQDERAELARRLKILDKRLESLDVIWSWLREDQDHMFPELHRFESEPETTLLEESTPTPNGTREKFSLLNEVDKVTQEIGEEITQPAVTALLQERFPDENVQGASVSNRLSRLRELGKLQVVRKGLGSRATIYRRVA